MVGLRSTLESMKCLFPSRSALCVAASELIVGTIITGEEEVAPIRARV